MPHAIRQTHSAFYPRRKEKRMEKWTKEKLESFSPTLILRIVITFPKALCNISDGSM